MQKIKALRQFSHFHLGTVDQGEIKSVSATEAEALEAMGLVEFVELEPEPEQEPEKPPVKPKK